MQIELSARDHAIIAAALSAAMRRDARRQQSRTARARARDDAMRTQLRRQWARALTTSRAVAGSAVSRTRRARAG
jgi:hypothetical protein